MYIRRISSSVIVSSILLLGVTPIKSEVNKDIVSEINSKKGYYLTGSFGYKMPSKENLVSDDDGVFEANSGVNYFEDGWSGEIGLGYDFGKIRSELTVGQSGYKLQDYYANKTSYKGDWDKYYIDEKSIFLNFYYDLRDNRKWSPYLGFGLGKVFYEQHPGAIFYHQTGTRDFERPGYTSNHFAGQFKLGLTYNLSKQVSVFAESAYKKDFSGVSREDDASTWTDGTVMSYEGKKSLVTQIGFRFFF